MKGWIILLIHLLPILGYSQANDSILPPLPPPAIAFPEVKIQSKSQIMDLNWADTLINKIQKICLVQLRPLCDDGKKRKTIPPNPTRRKKGCYTESVIKEKLKFVPEIDSNFLTEVVIGFDQHRMYKWKEIDIEDHFLTIESTLGKRESDILTMCYEPRHAVVFLDSMKNIIGIYELCFECGNAKIAFNYIESISIYPADYRTLKKLFSKYGYLEQKKTKKK